MNLLPRKRKREHRHRESPADAAGLSAVLGPAAVVNLPRYLRVGDGYAATLIVTGYPAEVGAGLARPAAGLAGPPRRRRLHRPAHPAGRRRPAAQAAGPAGVQPPHRHREGPAARPGRRGRRRRRRRPGRPDRPRPRPSCSGSGCTCACTPRPSTELQEAVAHVRAAAASVLLDTQPATWRQLQGWIATLPLATDSARHAAGHGHRRHRRRRSRSPRRTCPAPLPGEPGPDRRHAVRPQPGQQRHRLVGPVGAAQRQLASSWPAPAPARATSSSSRCCARWPTGCTWRSSTPTTSTIRLADAVGGITIAPRRRRRAAQPARHPARRPPRRRADPPGAVPAHPDRGAARASSRRRRSGPPWTRRSSPPTTTAGISNDPDTWQRPAPLLRDVAAALTDRRHRRRATRSPPGSPRG